ncbi:MAG: flagellar protein G [Thermoplasmata archaeon]
MPGTSASHIIFFIAAVIVASSVASIFATTAIRMSGDIKEQADVRVNELNTRVVIINDPAAMPYNSSTGTLVLYVKNVGKTVLAENSTKVFIDGNYTRSENLTFSLLDGAASWSRETVLEIVIHNITLSPGDHRAKVVVSYGKSATLQFRI